MNGDINGDEATSNDLAFVFDPANPSTPAAIAASMRKVLDNPRNVARDYLRETSDTSRRETARSRRGPNASTCASRRRFAPIHGQYGGDRARRVQCRQPAQPQLGRRSINSRSASRIRIRSCSAFRYSTSSDSIRRRSSTATRSMRISACCKRREILTRSSSRSATVFESTLTRNPAQSILSQARSAGPEEAQSDEGSLLRAEAVAKLPRRTAILFVRFALRMHLGVYGQGVAARSTIAPFMR